MEITERNTDDRRLTTKNDTENGNVMSEVISSFKELRVYQASFHLQQEIFKISKSFPKEEQDR